MPLPCKRCGMIENGVCVDHKLQPDPVTQEPVLAKDFAGEVEALETQLAEAQNRIDAMRRKYCTVTESPEGAFERLINERNEAQAEAYKAYSDSAALLTHAHRERDEARALNVFFRDSVGECHVMISRNSSEYQIRREWEATDLPPRLQKVMKSKEDAEAQRDALAKALRDQPCRCKCLTHGFGCGIGEATCHKDYSYECSRCEALATLDRPAPADGGKP